MTAGQAANSSKAQPRALHRRDAPAPGAPFPAGEAIVPLRAFCFRLQRPSPHCHGELLDEARAHWATGAVWDHQHVHLHLPHLHSQAKPAPFQPGLLPRLRRVDAHLRTSTVRSIALGVKDKRPVSSIFFTSIATTMALNGPPISSRRGQAQGRA